MAGGQAIDLESAGRTLDLSETTAMHRMKTGALIRASVQLGARCGEPLAGAEAAALDAYAGSIGLAFQIVDDLLDVEGAPALIGKTAGKDAANKKPTFVSLLGLAGAKSRAEELRSDAQTALGTFADRARRLSELADWIVDRKF